MPAEDAKGLRKRLRATIKSSYKVSDSDAGMASTAWRRAAASNVLELKKYAQKHRAHIGSRATSELLDLLKLLKFQLTKNTMATWGDVLEATDNVQNWAQERGFD